MRSSFQGNVTRGQIHAGRQRFGHTGIDAQQRYAHAVDGDFKLLIRQPAE